MTVMLETDDMNIQLPDPCSGVLSGEIYGNSP